MPSTSSSPASIAITAGCSHRPHTRFVPLTNTTYCLRCAPTSSSSPSPATDANTTNSKSSSSTPPAPPQLLCLQISEMLREAESNLRTLEKSRRLSLCCLAEELTVKDLEDIRIDAKKKVDETMLGILRRLEQVQKNLYKEVDAVVDKRLTDYNRLRTLIEQCDSISKEVAEPLSWRNAYDNTSSIIAAIKLDRILMMSPSSSSSSNTNMKNHQDQQKSSSTRTNAQTITATKMMSVSEEMYSLLESLHKTLNLEIISKSQKFALDESDLQVFVKEDELEVPLEEFAASTERSMMMTSNSNDKSSHNNDTQDVYEREREYFEESERIRSRQRVAPKHFYGNNNNDQQQQQQDSSSFHLTSRNSRSELLATRRLVDSTENDQKRDRIRREQESMRNEIDYFAGSTTPSPYKYHSPHHYH